MIPPICQFLLLHYNDEKNRLKTFVKWKKDSELEKNNCAALARNGFISLDVGIKVKCVFCFNNIETLEIGDDIVSKHYHLRRDCPLYFPTFIGSTCKITYGGNIELDEDLFFKDYNRFRKLYYEYEDRRLQQIKLEAEHHIKPSRNKKRYQTRYQIRLNEW